MADVQVLARIDAARYWQRSPLEREEIRLWLIANGIDPSAVLARPGIDIVEVQLLDAPMIVRCEHINGWAQVDENRELRTRVVHSLLRVPLPEHLADPC